MTKKSTALARIDPAPKPPPLRMLRLDLGGEVPAVVQVLQGETDAEALHRFDRQCAEKARAQGLGFLLCEHCDRPGYVCRKDPWTCAERRERAKKKDGTR